MKKGFFTLTLCILALTLYAQEIEKIWGVGTDFDSKVTISNAEVEIVGMRLTAKTDDRGNFSIYAENPTSKVTIKIYKENYEPFEVEITLPLKVPYDVRLKKVNKPTVIITQLDFGREISGQISGLTTEMEGKYKIVVFVFTNTYWIHPLANSKFVVKTNGTWRMQSIWHPDSPCPTRVLAMLVDIDYTPQSPAPDPVGNDVVSYEEVGVEKIKCQ
ncbi:MAG: hypothetical protein IPL46_29945 [Saprospiraceae bacterium]|nr:hypothetical protein [Saprospiraceae bacterium]